MTASFDAGDDDGPPVELPMLRCRRELCDGGIFQDARGGFECTDCDARYLVVQDPPNGYGGPQGRLGWFERHWQALDRAGMALLGMTGCLLADGNGLWTLVVGTLALCAVANAELARRSIEEGREKPLYGRTPRDLA